jgi:hypothetical protein
MPKLHWLLLQSFVIILLLAPSAFADDPNVYLGNVPTPPANVPAKKVKRPVRRLASADEANPYSRLKVANPTTPAGGAMDLRLGALGGYSSLTGTDTLSSDFTGSTTSGSNIYAGINADFRNWKYFGAELEGFYALGTKKSTSSATDASNNVYGLYANLKGQYPFQTGSWRWVPKLGAGYALNGLKALTSSSGTTDVTDTTTLSGPYATAGFDVDLYSWTVAVDYAQSIAAKGSFSESLAEGTGSSTSLENASFNRIRLGVYYNFSPHLTVGAQGILRSFSFVFPASATGGVSFERDISQTQALAVFFYRF